MSAMEVDEDQVASGGTGSTDSGVGEANVTPAVAASTGAENEHDAITQEEGPTVNTPEAAVAQAAEGGDDFAENITDKPEAADGGEADEIASVSSTGATIGTDDTYESATQRNISEKHSPDSPPQEQALVTQDADSTSQDPRDASSDSGGENVPSLDREEMRRRKRTFDPETLTSSDSSSLSDDDHDGDDNDDDDDGDDNDDDDDDLDDGQEYCPETSVLPNVSPLQMLLEQQIGQSVRDSGREWRRTWMGSVQLVRRMERQSPTLQRHAGCVNALHFNSSGSRLASGSDDLNIVIWDWARRRPACVFDSGHRSNVFQCKFLPGGADCHLVSCARDGAVRLATLSSSGVCRETRKVAQHKGSAHKLALLDGSQTFLSCGEDGVVFRCDLREEKPLKLTEVKDKTKVALYSIDANPMRPETFLVTGRDQFLRIYDSRNPEQPVKKFCPHHLVESERLPPNITCGVFSYNGSEVLASYNDEHIYLFDASHSDGADAIRKFTGHRNNATVKGVNFMGPRSEVVVSGSDCGNVFWWHKDTGIILNTGHGDEGGVVNVLEPHPTSLVLATSGLDNDVKIWTPTAKEPASLKGLNKQMKINERDRNREAESIPFVDSRVLQFMLQTMRRQRQRQEMMGSDEEDEDSDSDSDNQQCMTS